MSNIHLSILDNPFNPSAKRLEVVEWSPEKSVFDYIPKDFADYALSMNSQIVDPENAKLTFPKENDYISVVNIPLGGDDSKSFLRLAAFAGLSFFSGGIGSALAGKIGLASKLGVQAVTATNIATSVVQIAGSLLISAVMPPPTIRSEKLKDGPSYGIDSAGNTAREGVPVPMTYGQMRTAGNIVQISTENDGTKNQDVNMLICVGEAPIEDVTDVEINDQPIESYKNWSYAVKTSSNAVRHPYQWDKVYSDDGNGGVSSLPSGGTDARNRAPENNGAYTSFDRSITLDETYSVYTTSIEVNRVRIDLVAPGGLYTVSSKGQINSHTVPISAEYRLSGSGPWLPLEADIISANDVPVYYDYDYNITVNYAFKVGSEDVSFVNENESLTEVKTNLESQYDEVVWNGNTGVINRLIPEKTVYANEGNASTIQPEQFFPNIGTAARATYFTSKLNVTGRSRNALRYSLKSPSLSPEGIYEVRVKRDNAQVSGTDPNARVQDEIVWSVMNEIVDDKIGYKQSAMMAVKIKLSDQLRGIPKVTYVSNGRRIKEWTGTVSQGSWTTNNSSNPAWVAWDMLTSNQGVKLEESRLDFYAWVAWAEYCDSEGLEFNGIFDTNSNIWDSLQVVLRTGRAQILLSGTSYTVIVEKPEVPSMVFGNGNIIEGTLSTTWMPLSDRANVVDVTFNDRDNRYKPSTIKVYNEYDNRDREKLSSITLIGVTDRAIAEKEAVLHLNMNKYIRQSVSFETTLEALGVIPGDVVGVQNDHAAWSDMGFIESVNSATNFTLDKSIQLLPGTNSMMMHFPRLHQTFNVASTTANSVTFATNVTPFSPGIRLEIQGEDLEVLDIEGDTVYVTSAAGITATGTGNLVQTDVSVIRDITTGDGTVDTVEVASAFPDLPVVGAKWFIGVQNLVTKPFRVTNVEMGSDPYKRRISGVEYYDEIYSETITSAGPLNYSQSAITRPIGPVRIIYEDLGTHVSIVALAAAHPNPEGPKPYALLTSGNYAIYNKLANVWVDSGSSVLPTDAQNKDLSSLELSKIVDGVVSVVVSLKWDAPILGSYDGADIYFSENGAPYEQLATVYGHATSYEHVFAPGDHIIFKIVAIGSDGKKYPYSSSPTTEIYLNESPRQVGDVNLPEEMQRGALGDIWFRRHDPDSSIIIPDIDIPALATTSSKVIEVYGSKFYHPDGTTRVLRDTSEGDIYRVLDTPFIGPFVYRPFYLYYSDEDIRTRLPTFDVGFSTQYQIFCAAFDDSIGEWSAIDSAGNFIPFQQRASDFLMGRGSKITSVGGIDILVSFMTTNQKLPDDAATANNTFAQDVEPSAALDPLKAGDIWINTADGNTIHRYNGSLWIKYRDAGVSAALEAAATFESTQDGKTISYFQDNAPIGAKTNDFWFDTNDGNAIYKYDGSTFLSANNDLLAQAIRTYSTPAGIADSQLIVYYSSVQPASSVDVDDLWYSTSTKDLSIWNGSNWNVVSTVGTHWDDVDGDGKPDSYVGNTGDQMIPDFNFQIASKGEKSTWKTHKFTASTPNIPITQYSGTANVSFSTSSGQNGSAAAVMYGSGTADYISCACPVYFPVESDESFSLRMVVKTDQTGVSGDNGFTAHFRYYDAFLAEVGSSPLASSSGPLQTDGTIWNSTSNSSFHIMNRIIKIPNTLNNVSFMTVELIAKTNNGSNVTISEADLKRKNSESFQDSFENLAIAPFGGANYNLGGGSGGTSPSFSLGSKPIDTDDNLVSAVGDKITFNISGLVKHPTAANTFASYKVDFWGYSNRDNKTQLSSSSSIAAYHPSGGINGSGFSPFSHSGEIDAKYPLDNFYYHLWIYADGQEGLNTAFFEFQDVTYNIEVKKSLKTGV